MSVDMTAEEAGLSWKLTALTDKASAEGALAASVADEWDPDLVVSAHEMASDGAKRQEVEGRPDDVWRFEAWYPRRPTKAIRERLESLFDGNVPDFEIEEIDDADWVTLSQQGLDPVRAGPFRIRTPDHAASEDAIDLVIPAGRAFGTGQHETTAGCLALLGRLHAQGIRPRRVADIGTGTGLLAIGALKLFPTARTIASDIDAVCGEIVADNARANGVAQGRRPGALHYVTAPGMEHPALRAAAPFDLLIANILAAPLIALAPDFARAVVPGGRVILAGLLASQEARVTRAYQREGLRPEHRLRDGDWSILALRKRAR